MKVLTAVDGDPGAVSALADTLAGQGEVLAALAGTLRGLSDPDLATWDSPAGEAFGGRARSVASVVAAIGRRYAVSAAALRPLGAALARAQEECTLAQQLQKRAWDPFIRWGNLRDEARASADPTVRAKAPYFHEQMMYEGERVAEAERRHALAHQEFRAADRRCATILHGLDDDGLADSTTYDALTGVSRGASAVSTALGAVSWIPAPPLKALAVGETIADATVLAADVTVRVAYGDGDEAGIALSAAAVAAGPVSQVLKRGAKQTNARVIQAAGTRAERRALRLGHLDRVRAGFVEEVRWGFRKDSGLPPHKVAWTLPPPGLAARRLWAREQLQARAVAYARNTWLDDLALVTREAGMSPRMHKTAVGVELAGATSGLASTGLDRHHRSRAGESMKARDHAAPHQVPPASTLP